MAYSLAKIDIRELKENQPVGVQTFELILGLIPIEVEGYTQIADSTEPAADEWSYFPKIKTLKINNSVLQAEQYLKYSLLVSNKNSASYALDPTNAVATKYIWPPYLKSAPTVVESAKNLIEGLISYNSISIDIQAGDQEKTRIFLGSNFSVMNLDFSFWQITNSNNVTKLYTGIGTGLSFANTSLKYNAKPKTKLLDSPATYDVTDLTSIPWVQTNEEDEIPILMASILPYSKVNVTGANDQNGYVGPDYKTTFDSFDKNDLVKIRGSWKNTRLEVYHGITFADFDITDYELSAIPSQNPMQIIVFPSPDPFLLENIIGLRNPCDGLVAFTAINPSWSKLRQPFDGATVGTNIDYIYSHAHGGFVSGGQFPGLQDKLVGYSDQAIPLDNYARTPDRRFKHLFSTNEQYNNFNTLGAGSGRLYPGSGSIMDNATRRIHYNSRNFIFEYKPTVGIGIQTDARIQVFYYNYVDLSDWFFDIPNEFAGDNDCFDMYIHWQIPVGHSSLSMQTFLDSTLKVAFGGATPDLSELTFNESMQMVEKANQSYRKLLEKILPSIGFTVIYDRDNDVPKLKKIDPQKAVSDTLTENDFGNLSVSLNTQDTYKKVIFRNDSMLRGKNTADDYAAYDYNVEYNSSNTLNETKTEKIIPMLTMESSRAAEIAGWHHDNKFNYKFTCPSIDRFLDLEIGDTIYLQSSLVPEASGQAKILITQRSISETSISFEGIKFASIN